MIIINFVIQAVKIVVLLGILVIIHELAHFSVAKFFKMSVKEFAIGFGKKLWTKKIGETNYSIRIFPLGGFVDLGDDDREGGFSKAPLYQKNLVLVAGSFINFIFALLLAFIVLAMQGNFVTNIVDYVKEDTNASQYIMPGDEIYSINGKSVNSKTQISTLMYNNKGENLEIEVIRNGEKLSYSVKPYIQENISTGFSVNFENEITIVQSNMKEKLQIGDVVTKIQGVSIANSGNLVEEASKYIAEAITIEVLRDNVPVQVVIDVKKIEQYYIGIVFLSADDNVFTRMYYAGIGAGDFLYETLKGLVQLFTGKAQNAELMGIVGVSDIISKTGSAIEYFAIMASVSLSLAIINMLPLPLLDGGKMVIYTIERYRKKQFSDGFINIISAITLALLIGLTIYVTINDIIRIV